jgi:CMP-N,N'-diacetyllegionaminic acid synthase
VSTLFVVPARGGSKGLVNKNLRKLAGKSLTFWALDFARKYKTLNPRNDVCLSSDSDRILNESRFFSDCIKLRRPAAISSDTAIDVDVLRHAISSAQELTGKEYQFIVMLQPTAPSRRHQTFAPALGDHISGRFGATATWSVSIVPEKFRTEKLISEPTEFGGFQVQRRRSFPPRRQDLALEYFRNGEFYILSASALEDSYLVGSKLHCVVTTDCPVNIDSEQDLLMARRLLSRRM